MVLLRDSLRSAVKQEEEDFILPQVNRYGTLDRFILSTLDNVYFKVVVFLSYFL